MRSDINQDFPFDEYKPDKTDGNQDFFQTLTLASQKMLEHQKQNTGNKKQKRQVSR